ncbi:hypothetical protein ABZT43_37685, partial [Streptomyces sp. NPDC005349]|uniref:hypothetical protein n=1 Tax=Streptomyces sp. NPDC005349 TaxID=3157037 RepID=UPI0033BE1732
MSQQPHEEAAINATKARDVFYALVKRAEEEGRTTLVHKRRDRALLAGRRGDHDGTPRPARAPRR